MEWSEVFERYQQLKDNVAIEESTGKMAVDPAHVLEALAEMGEYMKPFGSLSVADFMRWSEKYDIAEIHRGMNEITEFVNELNSTMKQIEDSIIS